VSPNESRPRGRALALRRRRQAVTPQDIADRLIRTPPAWATCTLKI
jgi:hypothetical protein